MNLYRYGEHARVTSLTITMVGHGVRSENNSQVLGTLVSLVCDKSKGSNHSTDEPSVTSIGFINGIDLFPNWQNSVQIATLQMIGHALLSTNFKTLQSHLQT